MRRVDSDVVTEARTTSVSLWNGLERSRHLQFQRLENGFHHACWLPICAFRLSCIIDRIISHILSLPSTTWYRYANWHRGLHIRSGRQTDIHFQVETRTGNLTGCLTDWLADWLAFRLSKRLSKRIKAIKPKSKRTNERAISDWSTINKFFDLSQLTFQYRVTFLCVSFEDPMKNPLDETFGWLQGTETVRIIIGLYIFATPNSTSIIITTITSAITLHQYHERHQPSHDLHSLRWLPVRERFQFKQALLIYRARAIRHTTYLPMTTVSHLTIPLWGFLPSASEGKYIIPGIKSCLLQV